ncbi:GNAT superfamily N-acetyltransferase [Nakamurella sp. UYEF19]|uniref:GNAT family N-acetyltransferase n=1 Tax=Nakamurella sp. UYEF19 TaxID=1756392 RepID=UPI00339A9DE4
MAGAYFDLRDATEQDAAFIELMALAAANWLSERQLSLDQLRSEPDLHHYVAGWPRSGDTGVIATDRTKSPIGAVWIRQFSPDDRGYGYVDADVPELSIGVLDQWRGQGVGRALMRAQVDQARSRGLQMISLSVERANPAVRLYLSEGWRVVESGRDSDTMICEMAS